MRVCLVNDSCVEALILKISDQTYVWHEALYFIALAVYNNKEADYFNCKLTDLFEMDKDEILE